MVGVWSRWFRPGAGSLDSVRWDPAVDTIDHTDSRAMAPTTRSYTSPGPGSATDAGMPTGAVRIRRSRVAGTRLLAGAVALLDPDASVFRQRLGHWHTTGTGAKKS